MTSRISLAKMLKREIRSTLWLPVLIGIFGFFLFFLRYLMQIESVRENVRMIPSLAEEAEQTMLELTCRLFGSGDTVTLVALCVAAILCAVVSFAYLDTRERVDFYHSLALSRNQLYRIAFLRGWLSAVLPYAGMILISFFCIGLLHHLIRMQTVLVMLAGMGTHILAFSSVYAVAVLAMILTGRILTGVLMSLFLLGYGPACYLLFWMVVDMNYATYWNAGMDYTIPVQCLSPLVDIAGLAESATTKGVSERIILALWMVASIWIGRALYRRRQSEAAENAMMHPRLESCIKVMTVIPGAILFGILLWSLSDAGYLGMGWFFGGSLIGAFLLNGIMEFIYTPDLRNSFRHWKSAILGIGAVAAITGLLIWDPVGYDRWLPKPSEIEAMAWMDIQEVGLFGDVYEARSDILQETMRQTATSDIGSMYAAVQEAIEQNTAERSREMTAGGVYYEEAESTEVDMAGNLLWEESYVPDASVVVYYRLQSGKEKFRIYKMAQRTARKVERVLSQDPAQSALLYPITQLNREQVRDFEVGYWVETDPDEMQSYQEKKLDLSPSEIQKLADLLEKETLAYGLVVTETEGEYFQVDLFPVWAEEERAEQNGPFGIYRFTLYPQYQETLQYIRDKGISLPQTAEDETREKQEDNRIS